MRGLDFAAAGAATRLRRTLDAAPRPCRTNPDLFFPIGSGPAFAAQVAAAKNVCAGCPVVRECLDWALLVGEEHGIWGGLDADERRAMRRSSVHARRTQRHNDLDVVVEQWLATIDAPSPRRALRSGFAKYRSWCDDDGIEVTDTDVDLREFTGWLTELRVNPRAVATAVRAAQSWIAFLHRRKAVA